MLCLAYGSCINTWSGAPRLLLMSFLQRCRCALSTHGPADPESVSWAAGGTLENWVPLFLLAQGETVLWEVECSVAQTHFSGTSKWLCIDRTTHYLLQAVATIKGSGHAYDCTPLFLLLTLSIKVSLEGRKESKLSATPGIWDSGKEAQVRWWRRESYFCFNRLLCLHFCWTWNYSLGLLGQIDLATVVCVCSLCCNPFTIYNF